MKLMQMWWSHRKTTQTSRKSWLNKFLKLKKKRKERNTNQEEPWILSICLHLKQKQSIQTNPSHQRESTFEYKITQVCSHVRSPSLPSALVSLELFKVCSLCLSPLSLMPQMGSRLSHIVMLQCVNRRNYKRCTDTLLTSICADGRKRAERGYGFFFSSSRGLNGWKGFELDGNLRTGSDEVKEEILKKNNAGLCVNARVWPWISE